MTDASVPSRCFRCGGPADVLNELEEGVNCPACADRLLESLQGIFHTPWGEEAEGRRAPMGEDDSVEEHVELEARPRALGPRPLERRPDFGNGGHPYDGGPRPA